MAMKPSAALGLWSLQFGTMIAFAGWAAADPLFMPLLDAVRGFFSSPDFEYQRWIAPLGLVRPIVITTLLSTTGVAMICILIGMLGRSNTDSALRSVSAWMMLTTIIAMWCGLVVNVEAIAWNGKRIRIASQVEALERIAIPLRETFPGEDGELPYLGAFMAYPFGKPSTLILLQTPKLNSDSVCISAVQRSSTGAILLQLSGADGGDWVEWHPPSSSPQSFVGGLGDRHIYSSSKPIGCGWYLVRYAET